MIELFLFCFCFLLRFICCFLVCRRFACLPALTQFWLCQAFANFLSRGSNHLILNWKTAKSVRVSQMFVYCDDCSTVLVLCTNADCQHKFGPIYKMLFHCKIVRFRFFVFFETILKLFNDLSTQSSVTLHDFGRHSVADKFNL